MKRRWHVYILRCRDKSLYTGITVDVAQRVALHNAGKGAKYTRARRPVQLVWSKAMPTGTTARKKEAEIKKLTRAEKLRLIARP